MKQRFVNFVRLGVASGLTGTQAGLAANLRPELAISSVLQSSTGFTATETASVDLLGPADVHGLDASIVTRMLPMPDDAGADIDSFAHVEFSRPDLPWLFTPVAPVVGPQSTETLRPFVTLIVLREQAGVTLRPATSSGPAVIEIASPATLAELPARADSAAWAHVQIDETGEEVALADLVLQQPARVRSRLIAPRVLGPGASYIACVVPTYEGARRAGLGEPAATAAVAAAPSWTSATALPLRLPVYFFWRFSTSDAATFRALVARLQARPVLIGTREINATTPGGPVAARGSPLLLAMDGALKAPGAARPPPAGLAGLETDILNALDQPLRYGPPRYGSRQIAAPVRPGPSGIGWLDELNRNPVRRTAAGLGASVVRALQEDLMAECWEQAGEVMRANQLRRYAELALVTRERLYQRLVAPRSGDPALLLFAGPLLSRIRVDSWTTVHGKIKQSCLPLLTTSGAMRKLLRPNGTSARRLARQSLAQGSLDRVQIDRARSLNLAQSLIDTVNAPAPAQSGGNFASFSIADLSAAANANPDLQRLGAALGPSEPAFSCTPADLAGLMQATAQGLEAEPTLRQRVDAQVSVASRIAAPTGFAPIIIAPRIGRAMIEPLIDQGLDWLMPGLDGMAQDSVALALPNSAFIEAYLAGANDELSREMLWRGFPTDGRGTSLACFWKTGVSDIVDMARWSQALGNHAPQGSSAQLPTVIVVRGAIVRRFPNTLPFLQKAEWIPGAQPPSRRPVFAVGAANTLTPRFSRTVSGDTLFCGYGISPADAIGGPLSATNPAAAGWYVVFQERLSERSFGASSPPARDVYLSDGNLAPDANAVAHLRRAARVFVHVSDLVPPP